jgi:hypothetical protein
MPTKRGPYSPDFDGDLTTGRDSYYPSDNPRKVGGSKNTSGRQLTYIDTDNSVGSGPISDGRNVSQKPRKLD